MARVKAVTQIKVVIIAGYCVRSRVSIIMWGEGGGKKKMGKGRNGAGTAKCTPRLARRSNKTWGLSQELGHRRNLAFPGCGTASHGDGIAPGIAAIAAGRAPEAKPGPARPGGRALVERRGNGELARVLAVDKIPGGLGKGWRGPLEADLSRPW